MKLFLYSFVVTFLFSETSFSQTTPAPCDTSGTAVLRNNSVLEQWEYRADKKTKKKTFSNVREFSENGCLTKHIWPDAAAPGTYGFKEWEFTEKGSLAKYREGKIDADSAKLASFSEAYNYNYEGLLSSYRKDIYEGEMSQTVVKWEYSYSAKGEKTESSFSKILVRKDTISNDDIKYAGNGVPLERTINNYFPKNVSDFIKYNAKGLPAEYIRYEKGKMTEHKFFTYHYDKQGALTEINITDGVAKTNEKKKYEKEKITCTLTSTKGKVLKTFSEPYAPPATLAYPPYPVAEKQAEKKQASPDKTILKVKPDKKKNKIVEHYTGQKLVYSETYNPKGLLIEKNLVEGNLVLQYEYVFY
ncbi:MAG: hypothetical protein HY841_06545 [Bacteroidetes bacterium]|nr:hypothetical protein [Bacteroidota bacterium]